MRDYLHDPDDYAHLDADTAKCGGCMEFYPSGKTGWASDGSIHKVDEGWCLANRFKVMEDTAIASCPFHRGRP